MRIALGKGKKEKWTQLCTIDGAMGHKQLKTYRVGMKKREQRCEKPVEKQRGTKEKKGGGEKATTISPVGKKKKKRGSLQDSISVGKLSLMQ